MSWTLSLSRRSWTRGHYVYIYIYFFIICTYHHIPTQCTVFSQSPQNGPSTCCLFDSPNIDNLMTHVGCGRFLCFWYLYIGRERCSKISCDQSCLSVFQCGHNICPRKLQHTPRAHPRQSPWPTMKGFHLQPVGRGLGVCSKGVLKQP